MMKYKIYDKKGKFLGIIHGTSKEDAIQEAKLFDLEDAFHAEEIKEVKITTSKYKKQILFN